MTLLNRAVMFSSQSTSVMRATLVMFGHCSRKVCTPANCFMDWKCAVAFCLQSPGQGLAQRTAMARRDKC